MIKTFSGSGSAIDAYFEPTSQARNDDGVASSPVANRNDWGSFSKTKPEPAKRKVLFSLLHTAQWVKPHATRGEVPDLERLSVFLKSDKSPVKKPLKEMSPEEMEKIIKAFKGIVKYTFK
jgi:hypothetical protein